MVSIIIVDLTAATSFSNNYYSVLYRGILGWVGVRNVKGALVYAINPADPSESDEFGSFVPVVGTNGSQQGLLLMLRSDVELGVNTTSEWTPPTGPPVPNACTAFGDLMQPRNPFPGQDAANLTAQQNASCPHRAANLAVIADFVRSTALWHGNFTTAWAKMVTMGYSPDELCAVGDTSAACSGTPPSQGSSAATSAGVSDGALAGAVVGAVFGTAALTSAAWYFWGRSVARGAEFKPLMRYEEA